MRENTTKIRNIKQYLRAVLFNAPSTIDNYYTALVAHDMASPDWGKPKSGIPDYSVRRTRAYENMADLAGAPALTVQKNRKE